MIPFGPFEPDRSIYAPGSSTVVTNVLPILDGWGPKPKLVVFSEALPAACKGAIRVRTSTGVYRTIAFTSVGAYELQGDYSWTDISGSSAPFNLPEGDRWSFEVFGDTLVAVNLGDPPQFMAIDAGTEFADLPGSPPTARYVWTAGEFLVLGHIADIPNRVHTSERGDAGGWTVGQNGCDYQDFPDGEEIMGGIGAEKGAIIFQRTKIRQMVIAQVGDYSFQTSVINANRGVVAPLSIVQIGPGRFIYYSADGFFLGAEGTAIGGERVDEWFLRTIDQAYIGEVRAVADPFEKIVWFQAQDVTGTKFLLGYDWQLDRWCYATNNVTEMASLVTPGITWDQLDDLFATIDDVDIPFDSAFFRGGSPRFSAFDTDNKLGFFTGGAEAATLETADLELVPGQRAFLQEITVDTDCANYTLKAGTSDKYGGTRTWGSAVTPFASTGVSHFRSSAKFHRIRMETEDGAEWNHIAGLRPTARPEGRR